MFKSKLWCGITAVLAFVLALLIAATCYCATWEAYVNTFFDIENVEVVDPNGGTDGTMYFKSEFGDGKISAANQKLLQEAAKQQCYDEVAEGVALVKNKDNALPLKENERKITVFGNNATNMVYLPSGGGEGNKLEETNMAIFKDVMDKQFEINPVLWNAYLNSGVKRNYSSADPMNLDDVGEAPLSVYTDEVKASFKDYSDAAIIVVSREQGEGVDAQMKDYEGISKLAMHKAEMDIIKLVAESNVFKKVIVLVNSTMQVELGWVDEYDFDACLCIGTLGQWGANAIPDLLTGKANPSGHLVDTWAANSLSAPACVNSGTETPKYENLEEIAKTVKDPEKFYAYMSVEVEGIYVGYKYYETRYEDAILNRGGAKSAVGAIAGSTEWNYAKEMCYPFGAGLSYTTFTQTLDSVTDNDDTMTVKVTVKNTGSIEGKKAVLLYAQTPYGTYEKENAVEKSAIQIVQFGKTGMLAPGASETLTLTVDKYLLASYDYKKAKTYILSEGDYYFAIGSDIHDALNNILAAKGASGMYDEDGKAVSGDAGKTYKWTEKFDDKTFATSKITNKPVANRFDDCDINYFYENDVATYITRNDWAGTYPTKQTIAAATPEMIKLLKGYLYEKPADAPSFKSIETGKFANIPLIKLRGKAFDDPLWDEYLKQYTLDELASFVAEGNGTKTVPRFGVPRAAMHDGPLGVVANLPFDREKCTTFPGEPNLAGTYNVELIRRRGELMGEHSLFTKTQSNNVPGLNLHKTPFNGRSAIYFSEDSFLTYLVAVHEALGYRSKGVSAGAKHFVLNDQEFQRTGVSVFSTEQALREGALRAFESVLTGDNSYGCMMSFNRVGCVSQNNCKSTKDVTRDEWGFVGFLQTDASLQYSKDHVTILWSGTDLFSADAAGASSKALSKIIRETDDGNLFECLKLAVKHAQFNVVNSNVMNGMSENAEIIVHTPWWLSLEIAVCVIFGVITLAAFALAVLIDLGILKSNKEVA